MKARHRKDAADGRHPFDVTDMLNSIARPRLVGSAGADQVARTIRSQLETLDYTVHDDDFTFSAWPGRFGISVAGLLYTAALFFAAVFLYRNNPYGAIALLLILLCVLGIFAAFVSPLTDRLHWGEQRGVNIVATVAGRRPRFIVMAHRDSKSQPVPLSFRGPAIAIGIVVWFALFFASLLHTAEPLPTPVIVGLGAFGVMAGAVLIFCWVDNRSPGALDNASGVVAALGVAALERESGDVAFVITDAEELGLAGARAIARRLPPVSGVINLDGLDDEGVFYVMERFGAVKKRGLAPHLAAALLEEAAVRGEAADRRDMPFGVLADHMPLVNAGIPALTVMRGTLRSLRRVHLPTDDITRLNGDGIHRAIALVSGALGRLRVQMQALERQT